MWEKFEQHAAEKLEVQLKIMRDKRTSGKTKLKPIESRAGSEFVERLRKLMGEKGMTDTADSTIEA